ncbi:Membrane alanyl aminopeptidase [Eumeta japonica]|uniref:Aminopeptidase n=1 Tax=Eumeta variegata TaxID=151549 RepID=A0A4C1W5T8_EUMVA|nr:Membrane alanyl aminopeptidase [Eumeta japonica]
MSPAYVFLLYIVGAAVASPYEEMRSNLEFLDDRTNLAEPAYRLLDNVQPFFIYVHLDTYLDESRFNGHIEIEVNVTEANLRQIVMHQKVVSIGDISVSDSAGRPVGLQFPAPHETDDYYELLKINFADPLSPGTYTITIDYLGQINENPFDRGFYKGYYFLNGVKRYYATTQFQAHHARKAFPCFDEPQFKSQYVISITRSSSLGPSYSNMAISNTETVAPGRIRETFLPTPIISAYLIAFHVSDFEETVETGTLEKPFGIISRPGDAPMSQHEYAADVGVAITEWMDEYFDFGYYDMGQGQRMKNDHIALPDFPSGAMENWGMVNYREAYLLYDPQNTNIINKIFIATIMAHELAHKWFGNLVTCFWWSNLWLNESFASFFEYFGAHGADEDLELDEQFVVDYVHSALLGDAANGATPMNWSAVADNPSINAHFSTTSYQKGASVLRMLEHFVGANTFRDALRRYLRDNAYGLGTPALMYEAFRAATAADAAFNFNVNIVNLFDTWVQNAGAPVVHAEVNRDEGGIAIRQERFLWSENVPDTLWQIPITYTRGREPDFENTRPVTVLTERTSTLPNPAGEDWVILNVAQSGYYRVNYDERNWELLARQLMEDREVIHKLNRAQIVNDVLVFARAGKMDLILAFRILRFLKYETDYYVWAGALGQLDWFRRRIEHLPTLREEYDEYLLEQMEAVIEHLGFEERAADSVSTILNRMQIMNYVCNLGHEACVEDSLRRWNAFRANPTQSRVPVNLRRYVFCIGLREGGYADYQFLWQQYTASENTADMVVILRALACTKNQTSIVDYLQQSMHNDLIRYHDRTNAFNYALQGNPENLETVLEFVKQNFAEIREHYGGSARLVVALNALTNFMTDFEMILDFQQWLYTNQLALPGEFATGQGVISSSVANLRTGNDFAVGLLTYLRNRENYNAAAAITAPIVLLLSAIAVHILRQYKPRGVMGVHTMNFDMQRCGYALSGEQALSSARGKGGCTSIFASEK